MDYRNFGPVDRPAAPAVSTRYVQPPSPGEKLAAF